MGQTVGGASPDLGDQFQAMSYSSVSGSFSVSNVNLGGGKAALPMFEANRMLLDIVPPQILIDDVTVLEGDSGTTEAVFTVEVGATTVPVTVEYSTADDTATLADSDYTAASGKLTFEPGETTKTIIIAVGGDTKIESDETFRVDLSNATNADIQDNLG